MSHKILKQKQYDIRLSGERLTDELFNELTDNVMTNGCESIRFRKRTLEYPMGGYFAAKADMRAFRNYVKEMDGAKVKGLFGNKIISALFDDGSYVRAELIANQVETFC